jgi:hypothetical protein
MATYSHANLNVCLIAVIREIRRCDEGIAGIGDEYLRMESRDFIVWPFRPRENAR